MNFAQQTVRALVYITCSKVQLRQESGYIFPLQLHKNTCSLSEAIVVLNEFHTLSLAVKSILQGTLTSASVFASSAARARRKPPIAAA
jgi:hypothetical protein